VIKTTNAPRSKRANDLHQPFHFLGCQHRRGLIQDEQPGVAVEQLQNLHPLLDPNRQVLHPSRGVDSQPCCWERACKRAAALGKSSKGPLPGSSSPHHHVFNHCEGLDQHEILVDHADAQGDGNRWG